MVLVTEVRGLGVAAPDEIVILEKRCLAVMNRQVHRINVYLGKSICS